MDAVAIASRKPPRLQFYHADQLITTQFKYELICSSRSGSECGCLV